MKTAKPGSISEGTMHPEHLMPTFVEKLHELEYKHSILDDIEKRVKQEEKEHEEEGHQSCYWGSERQIEDFEILYLMLNECSPDLMYFGTHPGNDSDYGFWLSVDWQEDFEGLQVGDLSEVPFKYIGAVMLVNDHRNVSLYSQRSWGKLKEIWSIV